VPWPRLLSPAGVSGWRAARTSRGVTVRNGWDQRLQVRETSQ